MKVLWRGRSIGTSELFCSFDLTRAVKVVPETENEAEFEEPLPSARFKILPEHIQLKDTISSKEPDAAPDPTMGRDPDLDFVLRNA